MIKILIATLCLFLVVGCAHNLKGHYSHTHESVSNNQQNEHILNCVTTSGHHVYEETSECPLGGETFSSLRLGTHSTYGRHLDWEPISYMRFPVPIPVCPSNGFVVGEPEYTSEQLNNLEQVIKSKEYQTLYKQKHATYFLYAKTLELSNEKSPDQWWLYLNATWEANKCGDIARYNEYAALVIDEAATKLAGLSPNSEDYWVLNIVISNMYRRIGAFEQAEKYLRKIGTPELENAEANEFFLLAIKVLSSAIEDKSTERVQIKEADNT